MKVLTIVGARPQFIKCAPVSRQLRKVATEVLVHTGQHYDDNMSEVFFRELEIPKPDYNLGVGSGSHGTQTAEMLRKIEDVLVSERPDTMLVYGDTNSTLAGALVAAKLNVPVAHVEAGLRSFNRRMPEEINRVVTDHLSHCLLCPSPLSTKNLAQEGITKGVHLVGDVMYDALLFNMKIASTQSNILGRLDLQPKCYFLSTVHRAENTDDPKRLQAIVKALKDISRICPVVWPVHPRTRKVLERQCLTMVDSEDLILIDPVSYLDMLLLEKEARAVLTDSGGVQKEAFWLQVPCITLREETEWTETVDLGWNVLVGANADAIATAVERPVPALSGSVPYGTGQAAETITSLLVA